MQIQFFTNYSDDCCKEDYHVHQMEVKTTFLNGFLQEDIYMTQPSVLGLNDDRVCKLNKAIYGLKQAPRAWYERLSSYLQQHGLNPMASDHSVFLKFENGNITIVAVYGN